MSYYRKVPITLEARLFDPDRDLDEAISVAAWCGGALTGDGVTIPTLEGPLLASPGDYIVKGIMGEFWAVKPDIFEQTYEQVEVPTGGINA